MYYNIVFFVVVNVELCKRGCVGRVVHGQHIKIYGARSRGVRDGYQGLVSGIAPLHFLN